MRVRVFLHLCARVLDLLTGSFSVPPAALSPGQIQLRYYKGEKEMRLRSGPVTPIRTAIAVSPKFFDLRSALVAPPMLFQVRKNQTACGYSYSNKWVQKQHATAQHDLCTGNYECTDEIRPISCSGRSEEATYFGLKPISFGPATGYADFMSTLVEYAEVHREGKLQETSVFFDRHTSWLRVGMVLFSPNAGVLSSVHVTHDLLKAEGVRTEFDVQFFNILDGQSLVQYAVLDIVTMAVIVCILCSTTIARTYSRRRKYRCWTEFVQNMSLTDLSALMGDFAQVCVCVCVCVWCVRV